MPEMKYTTLGRTGLRVSVMGIGSGGPSRLGQNSGVPKDEIKRMVRRAFELGINFFDTAAAYGDSEEILGRALEGIPREDYVLVTKFHASRSGIFATPEEVIASVDRSLSRLKVDYVDVMQIHGVELPDYRETVDGLMPTLNKLKEQGKFRFIGISETYSRDPKHEMLPVALEENLFDTIMVGYNLLSPTPEHVILPASLDHNVGVICMCAVRRALGHADSLDKRIADAKSRNVIDPDSLPSEDPLGWLIKDHVESLPAAGYKYVASHPAMGTVLTGTANIEHLEANVEAILGPPLPEEDMTRLRLVFGQVWEPLGN